MPGSRPRCGPDASPRDRPPDLRELAAPTVDDLYAVTKNDVRLGVLDGPRVSYVEKTDGSRPLSDFSDAAKLPAHATALGRALLAHSPAETVDHLIRYGLRSYTSSTVATAARLRHALSRDQAAGDRGRVRRAAARPLRGRRSRLRTRRRGRRCSRGAVAGRSFGAALRRPRAHGRGSRTVPRPRTSRGSPGAGASRDAGAVHRTGGSAELTRDSPGIQQPDRTQTVSGRRSAQPALRPAGLSCAVATPTAAVRSGVTVDPGRTATDPGHLRCCDAVSSRESARAATTTADWSRCSW